MTIKLTKVEKDSALWAKLRKHLEDRLNSERRKNDNDCTESVTAKRRGRIAEIKDLLLLDSLGPAPAQDPSDD
jgi:hypothetical protein